MTCSSTGGWLIPEGHVLHPDVPLHVGELLGVRLVLDVGLHPHQGHKPLEARHALHKLLHEGGELADRGDEGGDVEEEGGQVDEIHPPPHEQESAEGDDNHGQDAHEELHTRLIEGHGPVVAPLGPPELVVGLVEFGALRRLVGEGLGGTHAGDGGLNLPVNARQLGLHLFNTTLGLLNLTVTNLGNLSVIAFPLGPVCLETVLFNRILILLDLVNQRTLRLPLGSQFRTLLIQIGQIFLDLVQFLTFPFPLNRLFLDFQLFDLTVQFINLLRHGIHLQTQTGSRLIYQVDSFIRQESIRNIPVR